MNPRQASTFRCLAALALSLCLGSALAQRTVPAQARPALDADARVIVGYRPDAAVLRDMPLPRWASASDSTRILQRRAERLALSAGMPLQTGRALSESTQVVRARGLSAADLARRLARDPQVAYAVPDERKRFRQSTTPNDPLYPEAPRTDLLRRLGGPDAGQWYLRAPDAKFRSAVNAAGAWPRSTGSAVVVAVLDTGILAQHLDLAPNLLPGRDFVSDVPTANDNDGWDDDPSDPGDWVTAAEDASGDFRDCGVEDSSWHGSKVAGIIAAATNNATGMAGGAPGARILPIRVLGKCGGFDSDIQAGMRWAAGLPVPGTPPNPNPARILNMSLGSSGICSASYQAVIAEITAAGAVVVAAAGNSTGRAVGTPANCPGVIAVAGLRHAGTKVGFSDLGPEITIAAPGGNCVNITTGTPCLYPILSATNAGTRSPLAGSSVYTDAYDISVGTSFAAPIVSATVALMLGVQPSLKPDEIKTVLRATARAFPTTGADNGPDDPSPVPNCQAPTTADQLQCYCSTALCGAGMLDAAESTRAAAEGVFVRITSQPTPAVAGTAITLSGSGTLVDATRRISQWRWALIDGGGIATAFSSATDGPTATLTPSGAGAVTVRLTVTDDVGRSANADSTISVGAAPSVPAPPGPTAPAPPSSGGGGTSAPGWLLALLLGALLILPSPSRARAR